MVLRMKGGRIITSRKRVESPAAFEDLFDFQLRAEKAPPYVRQYQFALPARGWRIDFAWPDLKLAAEIQGGIWKRGGGAHSHPLDIVRNITKYNGLAALGWRLLQFTTDDVQSGSALQYTMTVLRGGVPDLGLGAKDDRHASRRHSRKSQEAEP
jgi:very-short-patch-repair endonuclease